jgi:hypothetical protein
MSDDRRGLPHDLPEYLPNWPIGIKVRARVVMGRDGHWIWAHKCPRKPHWKVAFAYRDQISAMDAARKHVEGCW